MVNFVDGLVSGARNSLCGFLNSGANTLDFLSGGGQNVGSVRIPLGRPIANAYRGIASGLCPMDIPSGGYPNISGALPGPGPGGQGACATSYAYTVKVANQSQVGGLPGTGAPTSGTVVGPVLGFVNLNGGISIELDGGRFRTVYGSATVEVSQPFFDVLERADGGPENCADLPSGPVGGPNDGPPVDGPSTPDTVTYDDGDGGTVTDPVTFTPLPPSVGPNGEIEFCVKAEFENYAVQVCFDPFTNAPSIRFPDVGDSECCVLPETPGLPFPGDRPPDPPEREDLVLVAAEVQVTTDPALINETVVAGEGGGPNLWLPDLGVVTFGTDIGGTIYWSPPIRVQTLNSRVESPYPGGADLVRGIPRDSVDWTLTPIFAQQPSNT